MENVEQIFCNFDTNGKFIDAAPYGSGHINDTFLVNYEYSGRINKYILRKINDYVFKEPEKIVENTTNISNHIRQKIIETGEHDLNRKVLSLIRTKNGNCFHIQNNEYWCLIYFIEDAYTVDHVDTENDAFEAAKAYGQFQKYLLDFDTSTCHITIPDFHNLTNRIISLNVVIENDNFDRVKSALDEIQNVKVYKHLDYEYRNLKNKNLPIRIVHNDTKINNVMLDKKTKKGLCVVDLDTCMPGIILNDFGDMVRTFTSPALEDAKEFYKVKMRLPIFKALVKGYLGELGDYLTQDEIDNLIVGSKLIIYEQAVRFLTDYLAGDVYYKVDYDLHNLIRTKNQFALLESVESQTSAMEEIIKIYSKEVT